MIYRVLVVVWLALSVIYLPALAVEQKTDIVPEEVWEEQKEALDIDTVEAKSGSYTNGMTVDEADLDDGLHSLLETGQGQLRSVLPKALRSGIIILILVMLCQVANGFFTDGTPDIVYLGGALAITVTASADLTTMVGLGRSAIESMDTCSKALLPTLAAATAATGSATASSVRQMATMMFSDILITVISHFILPMVYAYIALCAAKAAIGNDGLGKLAGLVKWGSTTVLGLLLLIFTGYLTVSGAIAGSADAATLKTAKFTISTVIPVLGSILSDAAESVMAGAALLKNAIGIIGLIAVLGICLGPFLQLGIHYLIYKVTAALTGTIADKRLADFIDSISGAFGILLGMTGACGLLLLISIVSAVTAVKGG